MKGSKIRSAGLVRSFSLLQAITASPRTIQQLADEFGVTTRTVRRDLDVLQAARFPVVVNYHSHGSAKQRVGFWSCLPTGLVTKIVAPRLTASVSDGLQTGARS